MSNAIIQQIDSIEDAAKLCTSALSIKENTVGKDSHSYATTLHNLATVYS